MGTCGTNKKMKLDNVKFPQSWNNAIQTNNFLKYQQKINNLKNNDKI